MAIVPMQDAEPDRVASSAEYNKLITNIVDLDGRTDANDTSIAEQQTRIEGLEGSLERFFGSWSDDGSLSLGITINDSAGERVSDINTVLQTPNGCSLSNGVFTADIGGLWLLTLSIFTVGNQLNSGRRAIFLWKGDADSYPNDASPRYGLTASGVEATALTTVGIVPLQDGEKVTAMAAMWTEGQSTQLWKGSGNVLTAIRLAPLH